MVTGHWKLMAAGDEQAFLHIYQAHYKALFTYGFSLSSNRELTKDCLQDIYLELWNTRTGLNTKVIDERSYLMTWVRRKIFKELKMRSNDMTQDANSLRSLPNCAEAYEQLLIAFQQSEEDKEKVQQALKRLTGQQLEMIRLRFFEKLSFSEIAEKTSLSTRTIYNLVYEAMRALRGKAALFYLLTM